MVGVGGEGQEETRGQEMDEEKMEKTGERAGHSDRRTTRAWRIFFNFGSVY